jgi:hypothetical protein
MAVSLTASRAHGGFAPSRRGFIVGCAGLATAIGATAGGPSIEAQHLAGDLFAFTAPDRPEVVFAVTLPPLPFGQTERDALTVRLHAGESTWTIGPFALIQRAGLSSDGIRLFSGKVRRFWRGDESAAHLVAIATPARQLPRSTLGLWAEVVSAHGIRARIGNPAISHLLEEEGRRPSLDGQLEPARDRPPPARRACPPNRRARWRRLRR